DPANPGAEPHVVSYPAAGTANVRVSLAVVALDGSRVAVDWDGEEWPYLVTVHWSAAGPPLIALQTRDQRRLQLRSIDPVSGATEVLHEESDEHWIDIVTGVPAWTTDGRLVRVSNRDGAYRLVVDDKEVTDPGLQVRSVLHVGADVLFTASEADPRQVH